MEDIIGSINNKYIIIKKKDYGGTSVVFKVEEIIKEFTKIYAAKVLKTNIKTKNELYEKEIKILNKLKEKNNPYIVNLIDYGEGEIKRTNKVTSINKYLILDYASKGNLYEYIYYPDIGLKEEHSKLLFYKILQGIKVCHDLNICNRDIKLENILFDKDYNPKICDFGFADINSEGFTEMVGTKCYMDPQVLITYNKNLLNKKTISKYNGFKVDIFNLGIILFILRTGKRDFTAHSDAIKLIYKKDEKFWETLGNKGIGLSDDFKKLVFKMLSRNQERRPNNIDEVLNNAWFNSIKELIKDKEKLAKLEDDMKKDFKNRKIEIKKNKIIEKKLKDIGYNSCSLNDDRGTVQSYKKIFDLNLKPKYYS